MLHTEIQQFYGRHMQLLGDGDADGWALTFTEDAVFDGSASPEPLRGRAAIADGGRRGEQALAAKGLVHRRWLGMLDVTELDDGSVRARCYGVVVQTAKGGGSTPVRPAVFDDILIRRDDGWLIKQRTLARDDA